MKKIYFLICLTAIISLFSAPYSLNVTRSTPSSNSIGDITYSYSRLYVATARGISISPDFGDSFSVELAGRGFSALTARYGKVIAAASRDSVLDNNSYPLGGGLYISDEHDLDWAHITAPHFTFVRNVDSDGVVTVNPGNLAYDIEIVNMGTDTTIWAACFYGGLVRSRDWGATWRQMVTDGSGLFNPYGSLRHRFFSVCADTFSSPPVIYAGSGAGIDKTTDGGATWTNYSYSLVTDTTYSEDLTDTTIDTTSYFSGNWVVALEIQRVDTTTILWAVTKRAEGTDEFNALSYTTDQGNTWHYTAPGSYGWNFAFCGSRIFCATSRGLIYADWPELDWDTVSIEDNLTGIRITDPEIIGISTEGDYLFIGTSQGLVVSNCNLSLFRIIATYPSLSREQDEIYAFPSPFSPNIHGSCSIVFPLDSPGNVSVSIFDFNLDLVSEVVKDKPFPQGNENRVQWDGKDRKGGLPDNGVYFIRTETPGKTFWGKVMLIR